MEQWKDVVGYEGLYEISDSGNIRRGARMLSSSISNGYRYTHLCKEGIERSYTLHRLVALAFLPNPEAKPELDHINRNRADNRLVNLRWATRSENMLNCDLPLGTSGERYITPYKTGYMVRVTRNNTRVFCRCFKTLQNAVEARDDFLASM